MKLNKQCNRRHLNINKKGHSNRFFFCIHEWAQDATVYCQSSDKFSRKATKLNYKKKSYQLYDGSNSYKLLLQ